MATARDDRGTRDLFHARAAADEDRDRRYRRRTRHREQHLDDEQPPPPPRRERTQRRRADDARRQAELDIDDLRARREEYYTRPDARRRRHQEPMAQEIQVERVREKARTTPQRPRREGTRKSKRREAVADDRSDDYVYGRPATRDMGEEINIRRTSMRKRSDEGGSSSRTAYTPLSGSASASFRRVEPSKLNRSVSAREPSRTYATRPSVGRSNTIKTPSALPSISRSQSMRDSARKSTGGILANFFARPPPRAPLAPAPKEVRRVDCLACMDDEVPVHKTAKLACGHRMCHSCLKRQFKMSVQDPQHMPPRCCTSEHIPLKYAERLFDDKFKILWNKKYQEYTTENRLYCPTKGCGQWIKPSRIRMDLTYGRKYARCGSCHTKVCVLCNSKFHTRRECPKDEETNRLVQMAKDKGWQRCYNCKAVVELKEGCNHMTCRCTAQFCMVCAAPWKTCNCPWFNYQHITDDDRLNDMRDPYTTERSQDYVEVIELPSDNDEPTPPPPLARRSSTRTRHRSDRSRDLERADHALAAHLQAQLNLNPTPTASETRHANPAIQVYGLGNALGHHMNDSYTMRPLATPGVHGTTRLSAHRASFFRRSAPPAPVQPRDVPTTAASTMAGLSKDGTKRGANRVGTWLSHVLVDQEAIDSAPRGVDVDEWRCEGTLVGID